MQSRQERRLPLGERRHLVQNGPQKIVRGHVGQGQVFASSLLQLRVQGVAEDAECVEESGLDFREEVHEFNKAGQNHGSSRR
ncbi:hypothetical protein HYQ46_006877 [Verticillium longisporum]|nr:hypothetical protein HYQ46_006877 [Verticillium longisporum]